MVLELLSAESSRIETASFFGVIHFVILILRKFSMLLTLLALTH